MSVNLKINKHNNSAPTITTKTKESHTYICRFTCLTCRTRHYKTWQRLASDVSNLPVTYQRWKLPVILRTLYIAGTRRMTCVFLAVSWCTRTTITAWRQNVAYCFGQRKGSETMLSKLCLFTKCWCITVFICGFCDKLTLLLLLLLCKMLNNGCNDFLFGVHCVEEGDRIPPPQSYG